VLSRLELGGQHGELVLDFSQPPGQPIALLAERLRQRHHELDQPALALIGFGRGGEHDFGGPRHRGHVEHR
jgi:hypothetical protein